jgi:hypothetical protein
MKRFTQLIVGMLIVLVVNAPAVAQGAASEAEALTSALHYATTVGGKPGGSIQVQSSGPVPFNHAQAVFNEDEGNLLQSSSEATSFPFVLMSTEGLFKPNLSHPPGRKIPSDKYLSLIVDANTDSVVSLTLSPMPVPIERLGPIVTINLTSSQAATASRSCHVDQLLVAALARKHLGTRQHSAIRALDRCTRHKG